MDGPETSATSTFAPVSFFSSLSFKSRSPSVREDGGDGGGGAAAEDEEACRVDGKSRAGDRRAEGADDLVSRGNRRSMVWSSRMNEGRLWSEVNRRNSRRSLSLFLSPHTHLLRRELRRDGKAAIIVLVMGEDVANAVSLCATTRLAVLIRAAAVVVVGVATALAIV